MKTLKIRYGFLLILISAVFGSCTNTVVINSGDLQIEFDKNMYSRVNSANTSTYFFNKDFNPSEYLDTKYFTAIKFRMKEVSNNTLSDNLGKGMETRLKGSFYSGEIRLDKIISIKTYDRFPGIAIFDVRYVNSSGQDILVKSWMNHSYRIYESTDTSGFWSFQGSSSDARADWVLPVKKGFYQENFMGMNQSDYGGGIPVTDIWRRDGGLATGHLEMVPRETSHPVDFDENTEYASMGVSYTYPYPAELKMGDTLNTFQTFVSVHKGDYFVTLRQFSEVMQAKGIKFVESEPSAFESVWCGWGYERKFTASDIINTLPKVRELGIKWAGIDDGFQIAEGDWRVDTKRFPGGSGDMKKMVDAIHKEGLKAVIWWAPLAADPGSKVIEDNPDILLINKDGAPQYITWWDSYYMSPAAGSTIKHTQETVRMFLEDWGFDGLKLDGQHLNAVPADYNWKRESEYPGKSIELLPEFFRMIYNTAREIKPKAVIENCPCGTCMSFYNMPYTNQSVSSDPTSSWQIRLKGKTYKAIMPHTAYFGDHVELSDQGNDFASSFGVGAVLGTKFTWPADNPNQSQSYLLTPEKEVIWKKWFDLYHEKMLSKEMYLGELYDIGFDKPETHVIASGDTLYFSFFGKTWNGQIEFRGLDKASNYIVYDYVNEKEVGKLQGANPFLTLEFEKYLLLSVYPDKK